MKYNKISLNNNVIDDLESNCNRLEGLGVNARYIVADFLHPDTCYAKINKEIGNVHVSILVNSVSGAGIDTAKVNTALEVG